MIEGLRAIARFLPDLERPDFRAGEVSGGEQTEPGVFNMPFVEHSPVVNALVETAYQHGLILQDFDWRQWKQSSEAQKLRDNSDQLSEATAEQLCRLLTVVVRSDRLVDGALLDAFASGLILRIVRRTAALVDQNKANSINN